MIEGWAVRDESVHLYFGSEYHRALQDYDVAKAKGVGHDRAVRMAVTDLLVRTHGWDPDPDTKAGKYKNRRTLLMAVCWYLENFRTDPTQTYILENGKPAVELSFKFELDWGPAEGGFNHDALGKPRQPYLLCGHLDRVVIFNDELFVMDRKTSTTTLSQFYFNQFQPNNQMSLYSIASQVVIPSPVRGVIIDACQILMGSVRFVRDITQRTKGTLAEWLVDLRYHLALAETYASKGYWPQNDTACDKYGGCKFRGVCSKDPNVRKQFLKADFTQLEESEKWNPLKPR
jgi:hypothetical protein